MSKSSQFLSLLLVCEGFPLSNSRLLSYRSGKACTQILQLGQSTSSLSHCFPEPCEPSDPAFQTVYSWCPSSSAFIFLISLPFSIFPQIRKVPPYSEIWHKSLKFQRAITLSTKSFFFSFWLFSPDFRLGCLRGNIPPGYERNILRSHLFRKVFPNGLSLRKGLLGSTIRAFPGMTPSTSPCMMAVKQSVVGSGPTLLPGMSCSSRYLPNPELLSSPCELEFVLFIQIKEGSRSYLMNVVFPVEYCPTTRTMGLLSKSASSRLGEWKSWKP